MPLCYGLTFILFYGKLKKIVKKKFWFAFFSYKKIFHKLMSASIIFSLYLMGTLTDVFMVFANFPLY